MSGPRTLEPAVPLLLAPWPTPRFEPPAAHRGNAVDLCFDKVVRKCSSFVIACEACDTTERRGFDCLADLAPEEMTSR